MKRILVADDDVGILDGLQLILEGQYEVRTALDGAEALVLLRAERFDAVLLDLMMPIMSGEELLREMARQRIAVPVIVSSARPDTAVIARRMGALDYLTKPFDVDVLEAKLERVLQLAVVAPPAGPDLADPEVANEAEPGRACRAAEGVRRAARASGSRRRMLA